MLAAVALASLEGYFGVVGMTAIFASAPVPVAVMTIVLEGAKLVTVAWMARHWHIAPLALRFALISVVAILMVLTGVGTFGFFSRAHLAHQTEMRESIDHDAEPVSQAVALAERSARFNRQIRQLDDMVREATSRSRTKVAMDLVDEQAKKRADLVAMRAVAAEIGPASLCSDASGNGRRRKRGSVDHPAFSAGARSGRDLADVGGDLSRSNSVCLSMIARYSPNPNVQAAELRREPQATPRLLKRPWLRLQLRRNFMNYPLARSARTKSRWRKDRDGWWCLLPGDDRIELSVPSDANPSLRRCPTGFDMNVLFRIFVAVQEAHPQRVERVEFPSKRPCYVNST